jgi:hypothetical protein
MSCDPSAMRDYASKMAAVRENKLKIWRRPRRKPVPSTPETGEQRWEGEGGRVVPGG